MKEKYFIPTAIVTHGLKVLLNQFYEINLKSKTEIKGPAIILANHQSLLDIPLTSMIKPQSYYLSKPTVPMIGLCEYIGAIPIIRMKKDLLPQMETLEQISGKNYDIKKIKQFIKENKLEKIIQQPEILLQVSQKKEIAKNYFESYNKKLIEFCSNLMDKGETLVIYPQGERTNQNFTIKKERIMFYQKIISNREIPFYLAKLDYETDAKSLPKRGTTIRISVSEAIYEREIDSLKSKIEAHFSLDHRKD